jgi:hypothetical protein
MERLRNDKQFLTIAVVLWVLAMAAALVCVSVFVFGGGKSDAPLATFTLPQPNPTIILSGATVIAAPPAGGDGAAPVPTPVEAGAQASDTALPPFSPDRFGYGIQVQGSVGDPAVTVQQVKQLGMTWIKQQVRWEHMEPSPGEFNWVFIDGIINDANQADLYVMLSVVTAPEWARASSGGGAHGPPDNYEDFGRFLGQLVDRYKGKIQAIEVWNEQNLDREWQSPAGLNAADYVRLLQIAQREIKARDPNIIVISGALSPTGGWVEPDGRVTAIDDFVYFQQLLDAGMLNYVDCVGAHHNGINFPPDKDWNAGYNDAAATFRGPFDNPHHSWSFKSTLWGYYNAMNGAKKLCVTEFGWASSEGFGGTPPGFGFADDNTEQEQADWIVQAFQLQRQWGMTWIAYLWNLNYANTNHDPTDPNIPYSIVRFDGSPRPAFDALKQMEKP